MALFSLSMLTDDGLLDNTRLKREVILVKATWPFGGYSINYN